MEQDKYTARTLAALQSAQQIAAMRYHQEITSAHVLLDTCEGAGRAACNHL